MDQVLVSYGILEVFGIYTVYRLMKIFFEGMERNKKLEFVSYAGFYFVTMFIYFILNIAIVNIISVVSGLFLLSFNYRATTMKKRIVKVVQVYIITVFAETIVVLAINIIFPGLLNSNNYALLWAHICNRIVLYIIMLLISKIKGIRNGAVVTPMYWISMILVPLATIYIAYALTLGSLDETHVIIIVVIVFLVNIIVFGLCDFLLVQKIEERGQKQLLSQMNESYLKQYELMKQDSKAIYKIKHDLKNHLTAIGYLTENDRKQELTQYVQEVMATVQSEEEFLDTGNLVIDSILNVKIREAKGYGIEVTAQAVIPMGMPLNSLDITFILNEIMNRAIEESRTYSGEKRIKVILWYENERLFIRVIHRYVTEEGLQDYEYDEELLRKIERIVEAEPYRGGVLLEVMKDEIEVCVAMRILRSQVYEQ